MSETTNTPFPAVREGVIGAGLVQTTDARELHGSLGVGREFPAWIKGRISEYGFTENVDFVIADMAGGVSAGSGGNSIGRPRKEYHLTLDMAKELAMVENNERGRATRRYFIEVEKRAREAAVIDMGALGGMVKAILVKQMAERLPALVRAEVAGLLEDKRAVPALDFGGTVSAHQMIEMAGVPAEDRQRGTAQVVTRRMIKFCADRRVACFRTPAEVNPSRPFRFPQDMASAWLLGETRGLEVIRAQVDRMKARQAARGLRSGQASLRLVPAGDSLGAI